MKTLANMFFNNITCTLLSLVLSCSALVSRSTGDQFSLYAYGGAVGGLPLFYSDGMQSICPNARENFGSNPTVN